MPETLTDFVRNMDLDQGLAETPIKSSEKQNYRQSVENIESVDRYEYCSDQD